VGVIARTHLRSIIPVGSVVAVGIVVLGVLIALYAKFVGVAAFSAAFAEHGEAPIATMVLVIAPMVLLALLASLIWAGVAVHAANLAFDGRAGSMPRASFSALRRSPSALLVLLAIVAAALVAILLAPLLTIVGITGLLLDARMRDRPWWPRRGILIAMAVPFGVAVLVVVRWSLALESVWLGGLGARAALDESSARVRGRSVRVAVSLLVAGLLSLGVTQALVWAFGLLHLGAYPELLMQIVALILIGALPFSAATVLYREASAERPVVVPARATRAVKIAGLVIVSLVVPFMIGYVAPPAHADPVATTVTLTPSATLPGYGMTLTLDAAVAGSGIATGTVEFSAKLGAAAATVIGTGTIDGTGVAHLDTSTLDAGVYQLTAHYLGDGSNAASTSDPVSVQVERMSTYTDVTFSPSGVTSPGVPVAAHVTVNVDRGSAVPKGSVAAYVTGNATALDSGTLVGGAADLSVLVPPGTHFVSIVYTPNDNFYVSNGGAYHVVSSETPTVTVTADSAQTAFGESVQFTATVTSGSTPTASVQFTATPSGGSAIDLGSVPVNGSGQAMVSTAALPAGVYDVIANYAGDSVVGAASSSSLSHTVTKAAVSVDVESSATAPNFGSSTTLTATVDAVAPGAGTPSGSVEFFRDSATLGTAALNGSGVATLTVSVGDAGSRTFSAQYAGNSDFATGNGSVGVSVSTIATKTNLFGASDRSMTYGDDQTFAGSVFNSNGDTSPGSLPTGDVQLWIDAVHVTDGTLVNGQFSITTDRIPVGSTLVRYVTIVYDGDANHSGSDSPSYSGVVHLEVAKANSTPVLTIDPTEAGIGGTVNVIATLDNLGAGPGGTVQFSSVGSPLAAPVSVVDGKATLPLFITDTDTWIDAVYSGDSNFTSNSATTLHIVASRAAVAIAITDPGSVSYGQVFNLVATVSVGGGTVTPDHGVTFGTGTGEIYGTNVPIIGGVATLEVCAGVAADCPTGVPLGTADRNIIASYSESGTNLLGESDPYAYSVGPANTTTSLVVTPTTIVQGSAVYFTATVDGVATTATPTGTVVFYGLTPVVGIGDIEYFIGSAALVDGVAAYTATTGAGGYDLRWPATGVVARYTPDGAPFHGSYDYVGVTIGRASVTATVYAPTPVAHHPVSVQVTLTHEPGYSAAFTGSVVVTSDTGQTCSYVVTSSIGNCSLTFATAGSHSFTAEYSGDTIYLPASSNPSSVSVDKATPALGSAIPYSVVQGANVTVTWQQFDPLATGTVTVFADGVEWCTNVPLSDLQCAGTFGPASVTGSDVDIHVRYYGDANYNQVQEDLVARVQGCATIDVRSVSPSSYGTVTVDTPANCGAGGYLIGTYITATATPKSGYELLKWQKYTAGSPGLVDAGTAFTTTFQVTADSQTWVRLATFRIECFTVGANATGHGTLQVIPSSNCTTLGGAAGYNRGTTVSAYPDPLLSDFTGELDAFYEFGPQPAGITLKHDSSGRPYVSLTVTGNTLIPVIFGPQCHIVTVLTNPPKDGDTTTIVTEPNCHAPDRTGFVRGIDVTVSAGSTSTSRVLAGWSQDGVAKESLGHAAQAIIQIDHGDPVVTAQFVDCYVVNVLIDSATDVRSRDIGQINLEGVANCPDGSNRYLPGSTVTVTPQILVEGATFTGWSDLEGSKPIEKNPIGVLTAAARTIVISDADVTVNAGFSIAETCSKITVFDPAKLLNIWPNGCGPGEYFDLQKQFGARNQEPQANFWQDKYRTILQADVSQSTKLDVYATVRGDARNCFGTATGHSGAGASTDVATFGPLERPTSDCAVGGNIRVTAQACQSIVGTPTLRVVGDAGQTSFSAASLPSVVYLPDGTGGVSPYSIGDFAWINSLPISVDSNGGLRETDMQSGPCRDAGNAYPAGYDIAISAETPLEGVAFDGWADIVQSGLVDSNPVLRSTTATVSKMTMVPSYSVTCFTIALGEGISVTGDAARCPGSTPEENKFIAGTAFQVTATQHVGDRPLYGFKKGVISGTTTKDSTTEDQSAYVLVDGDKSVTATYPTRAEAFGLGVIQGLKIVSGIVAVAAPIMLSIAFPATGVLFAYLAASAAVASLVPNGGKDVAAVLDLINPTNITTCAARWAFAKGEDPTGPKVGAVLTTAKNAYDAYKGKDIFFKPISDLRSLPFGLGAKLPAKIADLPGGLTGITSAASLGLGLYSAGIQHAELGPQSIEQLADTETMTGCLNDQWRVTGQDVG
jgi:hypothetical protein